MSRPVLNAFLNVLKQSYCLEQDLYVTVQEKTRYIDHFIPDIHVHYWSRCVCACICKYVFLHTCVCVNVYACTCECVKGVGCKGGEIGNSMLFFKKQFF